MTKQQILDECARRVGDESTVFKSTQLAPAFDFVLLELSQQDCLPMLRSQTSFALNHASTSVADNLLKIDTKALLTVLPMRITADLLVPSWGPAAGRIQRVDDITFEQKWLGNTSQAGRPMIWRPYPNIAQLQVYPAPQTSDASALCFLEWQKPPAMLSAVDEIADVEVSDMPTLLAGLYKVGILFRDETFNDQVKAEAEWTRGMQRMKERKLEAQHFGRRNVIAYRDF